MTFRDLIHPPPDWLDRPTAGRTVAVALTAIGGMAVYGFSIGFWRDPVMGLFVAVKLPLLIGLTLVCNGLLNGLLALLLGSGLGLRQSLLALLTAFAMAALILGALAPVTLWMAWNAPAPDSSGARNAHAAYLVIHTLVIGFAGITANIHLHGLLASRSATPLAATTTLIAWLAGNGFLGAQFSWLLRPFFGSPELKVQFLRPDKWNSTFYEAVWRSLNTASGGHAHLLLPLVLLLLLLPIARALQRNHPNPKRP